MKFGKEYICHKFAHSQVPDVLENVNPELSDSEFMEQEQALDAPTPAISDMDPATPGGDLGEGDGDDDEDEDAEPDGDIDEELAAELDLALGDGEDEEDDEDDDDDDESEEEEEDEDDEESQARKLLNEEIRDLQAAVDKKGKEIASSANPLIRVGLCLLYCLLFLMRFAETIRRCLEEAFARSRDKNHTTRRVTGARETQERRDLN